MSHVRRDVVAGFRVLRKSPAFAAAVIGILALGIGANTAIFSVLDAVILRPAPFPQPERLMMLPATHPQSGSGEEVSLARFLDLRRENRSFAELGAWAPASLNASTAGMPERLEATRITPGGLAALRVRPLLGRLFLPGEEGPESRVAILSYGLWQSRFGGDPAALGRTIRLSGFEYPVVGVMPADFEFPSRDTRLWIPLRITPARAADRQSRFLYLVGRLRDGVSVTAAQQQMDALSASLDRRFAATDAGWGERLVPAREHLVGRFRAALWIVMATVLLLLAVACANVASLQLARASGRRAEMAIRAALGASSSDVVRQLAIEGLVLSLPGGVLGVALAHALLRALVSWSAAAVPRIEHARVDVPVLLFALAASVVTGVIFGLAPVRSVLSRDVVGDLRDAGRGDSSGSGRLRLRRLLTGAEIAGALVLLIGAGLLLTSLVRLQTVATGLRPAHVLTMEMVLSPARASDPVRRSAFFRGVVEGASRLPGVEAAAGIATLPFSGANATSAYVLEGGGPAPAGGGLEAGYRGVTPGYFRALGIPLLAGRDLSSADRSDAPRVALVNRTFASRSWPGGSAVGRRIVVEGATREIVGVVGDVRHTRLDLPPVPEIYVGYEQEAFDSMALVLRSREEPGPLAAAVRAEVARLDPEQPVSRVRTMERVIEDSAAEPRLFTTLVGGFAALALLLAVLGTYSVFSYSVAQRRREFAIRSALGARRSDVLALVLREGLAVAGAGVAAGLVFSWAATRALASLLFGVRADDPLIFGATALLLGLVAMGATIGPALRAAGADPNSALR